MTRVKRGFVARKRRKKVLKLTKGSRGSSSILFRVANQRKMKALVFSYRDRRRKKRGLRSLWISRINAAVRQQNLSYSHVMFLLKRLNIQINRKWLAQLAVRDPLTFSKLINDISFIKVLPFSKLESLNLNSSMRFNPKSSSWNPTSSFYPDEPFFKL